MNESSRPTLGRYASFAGRKHSPAVPAPTTNSKSMSMDQARSEVQPNFSRKFSDDYTPEQQANEADQHQGQADAPVVPPPAVPPKEVKSKKKWWSGRTQKRAMGWMDQVVKSGSRSGVMAKY
jgi:hypothetical protein